MNVKYRNSVKYNIMRAIQCSRKKVFLRSDFSSFGNYRQVSRALSSLTKEKLIAKISHGVYSKLRTSIVSGLPTLDGSFDAIAKVALNKLKVPWTYSQATLRYNQGLTTQVPANDPIIIPKRYSRKIFWEKRKLKVESK